MEKPLDAKATVVPSILIPEAHAVQEPVLPQEEHESPISDDNGSPNHSIVDEEAQYETPLSRVVSAASIAVPVVRVPRSERTGLLGRYSMLYEAEEPKNYPRKIKWFITVWIAIAAVTAPMGSSIIYPALTEITEEFHTTPFIANLSIALYMLSMAIFPLWWSSFSETAGRRTVYITSLSLYAVLNIGAAVSDSITVFIIMRVLSGGAAASVQAVGAGTVADIWHPRDRGRGMSIFYIGPLCGPLFAPIIGGLLTQGLGWRSTQWFQVIYGGFVVIGIICFLPETHHLVPILAEAEQKAEQEVPPEPTGEDEKPTTSRPALQRTVSRKSSIAVKTRKWVIVLNRLFIEPLKIIRYLRFAPVALTIYYASIAFCALYFLNISVEYTFSRPPYSFSTIEVGLLYISNSLGYLITSIFGGRWVDNIMAREARRAHRYDTHGKPIYLPEDRLRENAWLGALLMPSALLWYGWTAHFGVYWLCPILANFFYGAGSMLIFAAALTMLTEFLPKKASNGVALNNFSRNIFAFAGTMASQPAVERIGNGWLFTILGVVAFMSAGVIVAMKRWGKRWRVVMEREMD